MTHQALHFLRRDKPVALAHVPADRTLLQVLREDLQCTSVKEGCNEGDCGACTVVLGERMAPADASGVPTLRWRAINSCIRLAHSVDGMAVWTADDLPSGNTLHPAQVAIFEQHGSQCGFCTPGFVMSLFAMYQNRVRRGETITRDVAQHDLSGNLCRCTGYRSILDAAQAMAAYPPAEVDEANLLQKLELLAQAPHALEADFPYKSPTSLAGLLAARAVRPQAQLVAGATDLGLWLTKQHRQFDQLLDVTRVAELRRIDLRAADDSAPGELSIGAAVTLADAFDALVAQWPQLHDFAARFAGLPVRNSGTLGGNIANGSPIGDSMPLLIALHAQVVLASLRGERTLALEDLYTGYRQNVMAADEVVVRVLLPLPGAPGGDVRLLRAYKLSKRNDDDISSVCLAVCLQVDNGVVQKASIGAGGVAATPARARQAEAALHGQPWSWPTIERAAAALQAEFDPISDMRASGDYRRQALASLLHRFWHEHKPVPQPVLRHLLPLAWPNGNAA